MSHWVLSVSQFTKYSIVWSRCARSVDTVHPDGRLTETNRHHVSVTRSDSEIDSFSCPSNILSSSIIAALLRAVRARELEHERALRLAAQLCAVLRGIPALCALNLDLGKRPRAVGRNRLSPCARVLFGHNMRDRTLCTRHAAPNTCQTPCTAALARARPHRIACARAPHRTARARCRRAGPSPVARAALDSVPS